MMLCTYTFYQPCIDYLNNWDMCFIEIEVFECVTLREIPLWVKVEESYIFISNHWYVNILDVELFDEVSCVK